MTFSAALAKEVQEALYLNELSKAKKLLTGPGTENISWASQLLPYLDITTTYTKKLNIDKSYSSAGILNGTSQIATTTTKRWDAIISFHNPTSETLTLSYPNMKIAPKATTVGKAFYGSTDTFMPSGIIGPIQFRIRYSTKIVLPPTRSSVGNCFVLTACFGDEEHSVVQDFRRFRDDYLMRYSSGRLIISLYYRIGPTLASFVRRYPQLMAFLRVFFGLVQRVLPRRFDS